MKHYTMRFAFIDISVMKQYDIDTPYTKGLGGTQSSMCYYAEELAKTGHDVTVFISNDITSYISRGVNMDCGRNIAGKSFDIVIFIMGVSTQIRKVLSSFQYKMSINWIPHDIDQPGVYEMEDNIHYYDYFAFMSQTQRQKYIDFYHIPIEKTILMLNGVNPGFIGDFDVTLKKPRFVYTSQPTRGMQHLLNIWPKIVFRWPEAELHTFGSRTNYGFEQSDDEKAFFQQFSSMKNVFIHQPVGQTELVPILRESAFLIYPCSFYETGCIAATEAAAAGCIPIVSDLGVLGDYYPNAIHYDNDMIDNMVRLADEYMTMFTERPTEYYGMSERLSLHTQKQRDYSGIVSEFVKRLFKLMDRRINAAKTLKESIELVNNKQYIEARNRLENMTPIFHKPDEAYTYYLYLGMACYYIGKSKNAINYWKLAHRCEETYTLCTNMLLGYEALKDSKGMLEWAERSLKYKFNRAVIFKVVNNIQKLPYFERSKWGKYLLSLYNNDINNSAWLSFFVANGNMISADYSLVLKHEEGHELHTRLIENALASLKLANISITEPTEARRNIEKLFTNLFLSLNYWVIRNPEYFHYVKYFMEQIPAPKGVKHYSFKPIQSGRKLRLGFLTGDIKNHPVSYILNGFIQHINPAEFEIHVFSTGAQDVNNILQKRISSCSQYYDLNKKSVQEICTSIYEQDIDVLIEMTGHTAEGTNLINVLRHKPARVIANYFAFPNTYGIPECDYKIGDSIVFPNGLESYYVEKFCKLPSGMHSYKPLVDFTVNHRPHDNIVFGCTNNPRKYRPEWIKAVSKILNSVPNSKFIMRYINLNDISLKEFYEKEFEKNGIERSRIDIDIGDTLAKYFSTYADIDILLDPFPYNGGTINIEILYAGLPYITLLGNSYVSRVGASILTQIGHKELIARNADDYVNLAVELANSPDRITEYRNTLRADFMKSTLGDYAKFAVEFMNGVKWMLQDKNWIDHVTPSVAFFPTTPVTETPSIVESEPLTVNSIASDIFTSESEPLTVNSIASEPCSPTLVIEPCETLDNQVAEASQNQPVV